MAVFKTSAVKPGVLHPDWPVAISIQPDSAVTWSFRSTTQAAARQFQALVRASIAPFVPSSDIKVSVGHFAARLVCLDGIRPDALESIGKSVEIYRCEEGVCLEWVDPTLGHTERRLLSPLTIASWAVLLSQTKDTRPYEDKAAKSSTGEQETEAYEAIAAGAGIALPLKEGFQYWLRESGSLAKADTSLEKVAAWQAAWFAQTLPGPLFAHSIGAFFLGAVSRTTLGRQRTGKATRMPTADLGEGDAQDEMLLDEILSHITEMDGKGENISLLESALDCLKKSHSSGVAGHTRRLWATELVQLDLKQSSLNPTTPVLIGWLLHMCTAGTIGRPGAALSTIKGYARRALKPLAKTLAKMAPNDLEPQDWSPELLLGVYREVVDQTTSGSREVVRTALANFHWYLESILDIGRLPKPIASSTLDLDPSPATDEPYASTPQRRTGTDVARSLAEAEVVWEHELLWCIEVCEAEEDTRLGEICAIMLDIAWENPVRHQDLSRLVMQNVAPLTLPSGPAYEIEVVRNAKLGSLKSESAQRRLIIRRPEAVQRMKSWLGKRDYEVAQPENFLFGEASGKLGKYRAGAAHSLINRLLKQATGNPKVRLHHLRHSVISRRALEILSSCPSVDVSPLDGLAAEAGHGSPLTTLRTYTHRYEAPLRLWLDLGLRDGLTLSASEICGGCNDMAKCFAFIASHQITESGSPEKVDMSTAAPSGLTRTRKEFKPNSVVQAARRRGRSLDQFGWDLLSASPAVEFIPAAEDVFEWADRSEVRKTQRRLSVTYGAAADVLGRVIDGQQTDRIAFIHGLDEAAIVQSMAELDSWLEELDRKLLPRRPRPRSLERANRRKEILRRLAVSTTKMQNEFWSRWALKLGTGATADSLDEVLADWITYGRGRYLPLVEAQQTKRIFELLNAGGLGRDEVRVAVRKEDPSSQLSTRPAPPPGKTRKEPRKEAKEDPRDMVERVVQRIKVLTPRFVLMQARPERPAAYLQINSDPGQTEARGNSHHTPALKAWLVAWHFYRLLQNKAQTS